jgi:hypothetical protein
MEKKNGKEAERKEPSLGAVRGCEESRSWWE